MATAVQSVVFNRRLWSPSDAKRWLTRHGFVAKKVDVTPNAYRFRQLEPGQFVRFRTKTIEAEERGGKLLPSIQLVIGVLPPGAAKRALTLR